MTLLYQILQKAQQVVLLDSRAHLTSVGARTILSAYTNGLIDAEKR